MFTHEYSLEMPITVGASVICWCPDVPCTLVLDECGDLWKVQVRELGTNKLLSVMSGPIFDAAKEAMQGTEGDRIRDEAGYRGDRYQHSRPVMGVGFSGGSYAA